MLVQQLHSYPKQYLYFFRIINLRSKLSSFTDTSLKDKTTSLFHPMFRRATGGIIECPFAMGIQTYTCC